MNIAIVIAGGAGSRMGQNIPKQFLHIYSKPIIIYTLEILQKSEYIDGIEVVCLEGWSEMLRAYAQQFGISKLRWIIRGGERRHDSINLGINALQDVLKDEDIILIHDAVRPLVTNEILGDSIRVAKEKGPAMSVVYCVDSMYITENDLDSEKTMERDVLVRGHTPEALRYGVAKKLYLEAKQRGLVENSISELLIRLGQRVYFSKGSEKNMKLTTKEDIEVFMAMLASKNGKESHWLR